MTTLATSTAQVALLAAVLLASVAIATLLLKRRRQDVWQALARRHGLTFCGPPLEPRITGHIQGRPIEVAVEDGGSDRDMGGVEAIQMSVGLRGVPGDMSAEGIPGLIGDLAALAEERISFEQEGFHRDVLVKGNQVASIREYWSGLRQQTFLSLVENAPCDQISIREGALIAELREIVSDRNQLEQLLNQLLVAAESLDATDIH